ncbi:MAG: type II toxin-antitoxin system prevent-host-death family antitoxin [bacterium]|nr:type II toxin-antitoxin system prevent-host-death family antitoxin [bacterium]
MIEVSATKLRNNLFELLARVANGESITVQRNGEKVAIVMPVKEKDWRENNNIKAKLLVPPDEAFAPMEDVWEDYQ